MSELMSSKDKPTTSLHPFPWDQGAWATGLAIANWLKRVRGTKPWKGKGSHPTESHCPLLSSRDYGKMIEVFHGSVECRKYSCPFTLWRWEGKCPSSPTVMLLANWHQRQGLPLQRMVSIHQQYGGITGEPDALMTLPCYLTRSCRALS